MKIHLNKRKMHESTEIYDFEKRTRMINLIFECILLISVLFGIFALTYPNGIRYVWYLIKTDLVVGFLMIIRYITFNY